MDCEVFEKLSPTKLFFRCAVPSAITMAFGALFSIADGLFAGRFLGEDALAAINLVMPIIMTVGAISNMIATGASVKVSILLGEKKQKEASAVFSFSVKAIFIISVLIGIAGVLFSNKIVALLSNGATENAVKYGVEYLKTFSYFAPIFPLYFAIDNFLRVCGKEKISMWITVISQLLNIVLDFLMIAVLKKGLWSAAFASCISMGLGALAMLFLFTGKRLDLYYTEKGIKLRDFTKIIANGFSEFFSNISMSIMSLVLNLFLLKYGGTTAVAAFSVVMYVDSIIGMLIFGICDSLQPAMSYCYGAKLYGKVKAIFKRIIISAIVLSAISMLFMYFLGGAVAPIFVKPEDINLMSVSIFAMKLFSFSYLTGWVDMCFSSFFTALERSARSLVVSALGTLVIPIGSLFVLSYFWDITGVWLMPFIASSIAAIISIILALTMRIEKR